MPPSIGFSLSYILFTLSSTLFLFSLQSTLLFAASTEDARRDIVRFQNLWAHAENEGLPNRPEWQALLHYYSTGLFESHVSQADDPDFFLSNQGADDAKEEMKIALRALFSEPSAGEAHPTCRFPARYAWLRRQLTGGESDVDWPTDLPQCTALKEWLNKLNTYSVTLVFASSYLNSPSSMFGHTFLRLDPPNLSSSNLLTANTISYAADVREKENELMFAYRGIFGGYPGVTAVVPYYQKIKEYSDVENRDLWEYKLNLQPQEVHQLLLHAWELRDKKFDYYFFDENCAYRILALIDIARPETQLLDEIRFRAIPSDTVRLVVAKELVESVRFRPSSATTVKHKLGQLSAQEKNAVLRLTDLDRETANPLSASAQVNVLDTAFELLRYQSVDHKLPREVAGKRSHQLLVARSQKNEASTLSAPNMPSVRDDMGHATMRFELAAGADDDREFAQLSARPAFHDLTDPSPGYRAGSQLKFLDVSLRYYLDNDELQVEQFTGVDIISLSPRDEFFKPWSWRVSFGAQRSEHREQVDILTPYLSGGTGVSYSLWSGLAYSLLSAVLEVDSDFNKGMNLGPGIEGGWSYQTANFQAHIGASVYKILHGENHQRGRYFIDQSLHLDSHYSLHWSFSRQYYDERYFNDWRVGVRAYF